MNKYQIYEEILQLEHSENVEHRKLYGTIHLLELIDFDIIDKLLTDLEKAGYDTFEELLKNKLI